MNFAKKKVQVIEKNYKKKCYHERYIFVENNSLLDYD